MHHCMHFALRGCYANLLLVSCYLCPSALQRGTYAWLRVTNFGSGFDTSSCLGSADTSGSEKFQANLWHGRDEDAKLLYMPNLSRFQPCCGFSSKASRALPVSMVLFEGCGSGWSRQPPWPACASFRPRLPCSAVPLLLPVSRVCTSTSEIGSCQCRTTKLSSDVRFCHCSSRSARACNGSSGSGVVWRWGLEVQEWELSLVLGAIISACSYHECLVPRCSLPTAAQSAGSTPAYTELLQLPSSECVPPLQKIGSCQCHTTKLSSDVRFCHCWSRSARACNGSSGSGRVLPWGLEVGMRAVMSPWCHAVPCLQLLRALEPRLPKSLGCCSCHLRSVYLHSS